MLRRIDFTVVAMAAAAVIVLAACGGGGAAATSPADGNGTTSTQAAGGGSGGTATPAPVDTTSGGDGSGGGTGGGTGGGGGVADPCSLLTADEVGQVYGQAGVRPTVTDGFYGKLCQYLPKSGNSAMLWVDVTPFSARPCDGYRFVGTDIPNLGDWAYWRGDSAELYVKTGDSCLFLGDHFNTLDDTEKSLTNLARIALDRL